MRTAELYFDFSSTNSYFAAFMLPDICARAGAAMRWIPLHSAALFRGTGFDVMAMTPRKARYLWRDHARYSEATGLSFRRPSRFPIKTALALRCVLAADHLSGGGDAGDRARVAFSQAVFRSYWERDEDIADPAILGELAAGMGIAADSVLEQADSTTVREELHTIGDQAAARGVFGVPMVFVGDEMFWGKDRLDFVERWLTRA
ncbi:MAG: 2-hydroxychromene-2-carboxylate isomerase [Candidatus Binataceae bacterium]